MLQRPWVIHENKRREVEIEEQNLLVLAAVELVAPEHSKGGFKFKGQRAKILKNSLVEKKEKKDVEIKPLAKYFLTLIAFKSGLISLDVYSKEISKSPLLNGYPDVVSFLGDYSEAFLRASNKDKIYYADCLNSPQLTSEDFKTGGNKATTSKALRKSKTPYESFPASSPSTSADSKTEEVKPITAKTLTLDELIDICGTFPHELLQRMYSLCGENFFTKERIELLSKMKNTLACGLSIEEEDLLRNVLNELIDIPSLDALDIFLRLPQFTFSQLYAIRFRFNDPDAPRGRGKDKLNAKDYFSKEVLTWLESFRGISHFGMIILHYVENNMLPLSSDETKREKTLKLMEERNILQKKINKNDPKIEFRKKHLVSVMQNVCVLFNETSPFPSPEKIDDIMDFLSKINIKGKFLQQMKEKLSDLKKINPEDPSFQKKILGIIGELSEEMQMPKSQTALNEDIKDQISVLEGEISDNQTLLDPHIKETVRKYTENIEISLVEQKELCKILHYSQDIESQKEEFIEEFYKWFRILIKKNNGSWEKALKQACDISKDYYQTTPDTLWEIRKHLNQILNYCVGYSIDIDSNIENCLQLLGDIKNLISLSLSIELFLIGLNQKQTSNSTTKSSIVLDYPSAKKKLEGEIKTINNDLKNKQENLVNRLNSLLVLIKPIEFNQESYIDSKTEPKEWIANFIKVFQSVKKCNFFLMPESIALDQKIIMPSHTYVLAKDGLYYVKDSGEFFKEQHLVTNDEKDLTSLYQQLTPQSKEKLAVTNGENQSSNSEEKRNATTVAYKVTPITPKEQRAITDVTGHVPPTIRFTDEINAFESDLINWREMIQKNELNVDSDCKFYNLSLKKRLMETLIVEVCDHQCGLPFEFYKNLLEYLDCTLVWKNKSVQEVVNDLMKKIFSEKKSLVSLGRIALLASQPDPEHISNEVSDYIKSTDQYDMVLVNDFIECDTIYVYRHDKSLICVLDDRSNLVDQSTSTIKSCIIPLNQLPNFPKDEEIIKGNKKQNLEAIKAILNVKKEFGSSSNKSYSLAPFFREANLEILDNLKTSLIRPLLRKPIASKTLYILSLDDQLLCFINDLHNNFQYVAIPLNQLCAKSKNPKAYKNAALKVTSGLGYTHSLFLNPMANYLCRMLCEPFLKTDEFPKWDQELADIILKLYITSSAAAEKRATLTLTHLEYAFKNNKKTIDENFELFKAAFKNVIEELIKKPDLISLNKAQESFLSIRLENEIKKLSSVEKKVQVSEIEITTKAPEKKQPKEENKETKQSESLLLPTVTLVTPSFYDEDKVTTTESLEKEPSINPTKIEKEEIEPNEVVIGGKKGPAYRNRVADLTLPPSYDPRIFAIPDSSKEKQITNKPPIEEGTFVEKAQVFHPGYSHSSIVWSDSTKPAPQEPKKETVEAAPNTLKN